MGLAAEYPHATARPPGRRWAGSGQLPPGPLEADDTRDRLLRQADPGAEPVRQVPAAPAGPRQLRHGHGAAGAQQQPPGQGNLRLRPHGRRAMQQPDELLIQHREPLWPASRRLHRGTRRTEHHVGRHIESSASRCSSPSSAAKPVPTALNRPLIPARRATALARRRRRRPARSGQSSAGRCPAPGRRLPAALRALPEPRG
jgi:hypothetical protein